MDFHISPKLDSITAKEFHLKNGIWSPSENGPRSSWQSNRSDRTLLVCHFLGAGQLEYFLFFHPWKIGEDLSHFDVHIFQMGWFNHQPVFQYRSSASWISLKKRLGVFVEGVFMHCVCTNPDVCRSKICFFFQFWDRSDNLIRPKMMHCKNFLTEIPHPTFKTFLFVFCKQVREERNIPPRMGS